MYFFLSFFFLASFIHSQEKEDELLFVHVHFRHGARSPMSINEKGLDYFNNTWDFPGELTPSGRRMEYILGLFLRKNYYDTNFLSQTFDPREIYLISSDINRTIQSAYSMLQGLYPSLNGPELNEKQIQFAVAPINLTDPEIQEEIREIGNYSLPNKKNVIPVHLYNVKEHRFLLQDPWNCQPLEKMHNNNLKMDSIKEMIKKFNETMFSKYSDFFKNSNISSNDFDFNYIGTFSDQFVSGYYNNKDFSILSKDPEEIKKILELSNEILTVSIRDQSFANGTDKSALMSSSPVFSEMLTFMNRSTIRPKQIGYSDSSYPKMYFVSGHDSSVSAAELLMQEVFNLKPEQYHQPFYASNIRFELYRNNSANEADPKEELFYVKYYFQEELIGTWGFKHFNQTLRDKLFTDEDIAKFCDFNSNGYSLLVWILIILIVFCVAIVIGIIALFITQKKKINNANNNGDESLIPKNEN